MQKGVNFEKLAHNFFPLQSTARLHQLHHKNQMTNNMRSCSSRRRQWQCQGCKKLLLHLPFWNLLRSWTIIVSATMNPRFDHCSFPPLRATLSDPPLLVVIHPLPILLLQTHPHPMEAHESGNSLPTRYHHCKYPFLVDLFQSFNPSRVVLLLHHPRKTTIISNSIIIIIVLLVTNSNNNNILIISHSNRSWKEMISLNIEMYTHPCHLQWPLPLLQLLQLL